MYVHHSVNSMCESTHLGKACALICSDIGAGCVPSASFRHPCCTAWQLQHRSGALTIHRVGKCHSNTAKRSKQRKPSDLWPNTHRFRMRCITHTHCLLPADTRPVLSSYHRCVFRTMCYFRTVCSLQVATK